MADERDLSDLLRLYLDEVGCLAVPAHEEQLELARRIEGGDEEARRQMLLANLRLVVHWASRYQRTGVDLLDLIQEGTFGLMRAIDKFDWRKGFRFSTYASFWIRQAMQRGAPRMGDAIHVPVQVDGEARRLSVRHDEMAVALGREPTVEELAADTGIAATTVAVLRDMARVVASLDQPIGDGDAALGDLAAADGGPTPEEIAIGEIHGEEVRAAVDRLPERQRRVIQRRFGLDGGTARSVHATAQELGMAPRTVRKLEAEALEALAADAVLAA